MTATGHRADTATDPATDPATDTAARPVAVVVNGERIVDAVEPRTNLADFLRESAQLTGTHTGCHQGWCGACTVLVDGASARSCLTLTVDVAGAEVTTVEGLEEGGAAAPVLSGVQRAFIEHFGFQCGYCTPGMLVLATEILRDAAAGSRFDRDAIAHRIAANICRCTGYVGIVDAIEAALAEQEGGR